jgi:hypothetical protein
MRTAARPHEGTLDTPTSRARLRVKTENLVIVS